MVAPSAFEMVRENVGGHRYEPGRRPAGHRIARGDGTSAAGTVQGDFSPVRWTGRRADPTERSHPIAGKTPPLHSRLTLGANDTSMWRRRLLAGMKIRPVEWSDFQSFVDFYYTRYVEVPSNPELFLLTRSVKPSLGSEAAWFGALMKGILEGDAVCNVADADGRVVGAATVTRRGDHNEDRHGGVYANAIVPEWRGKGVGTRLMAATLADCRGKFEVLYLTVVAENARAIKLYRKHGFQECGRWPRAWQRGGRYHDDLLMWRAVDP